MAVDSADYETRTVSAGATVFQEGQAGREAFLIKRGRIALSRLLHGTRTPLDTLGPGAVFGEMAVIGDMPRTATAVAEEEAELVVIDRRVLRRALEASPPLVRRLMEHFQARLVATTERLSPHSKADALRRVAEVLELMVSAAAGGDRDSPALGYREFLERARQATGLAEEAIRGALRELEDSGEVACGPRKGDGRRWEQVIRVTEPERLGRRVAARTAARRDEAPAPEPAYLDLAEAGDALGLEPGEILRRLLDGELSSEAVRLRPALLDVDNADA